MLKKLSALFIALIIAAASYMTVFAGNPGTTGYTTSSAITGIRAGSTTGGALTEKGVNTTGSAVAETGSGAADSKSKAAFKTAFEKALEKAKATDNGQFIIKITKPKNDSESYYGKEGMTYLLSGETKYDDVIITIAKYSEAKGKYVRMNNTLGESSWKCSAKQLSEEIPLSMGANKIKIMAYRESQMDASDSKSIQINSFTITLLDESIAEKAVGKDRGVVEDIGRAIENGFKFLNLLGGK